ncbi:MAG TPA: methyltransferase domain-containing protein [Streptosporangiaceae bacterium]|jgi:ubiquinone/menaquinone biosynthesis C-methylase UbiE
MTDTYTHGHHESVLRSHRWRTAENSAAYLLPHLTPEARVLDVGCGPGNITADLAERVPAGRVTGIEPDDAVLAQARADAERRGVRNVVFETGDVYALAYEDNAFDVVHAHQVLQHLSDPVAALREMRRVCAPGGLVAARDADYAAMTWYPESPALTEWLDLYHRVTRGNDAEPDAGRHLLAWAHAAGFAEVTPSATAWCHATPDDRAYWGGMWADRILESSIADQARDRGLARDEDLARISAAWREWTASPDGWFGIVHGEILCRP